MEKEKKHGRRIFPLINSAVGTLLRNKVVLFPFAVVAFVQLLVLEILYFSPRWPLSTFFGPIISRLWSESYMHYPQNFILIPKLYQYAQIPVYIFISSFFIAMAINIINRINNSINLDRREITKETFSSYIHVVFLALIAFLTVMGLFKLYGIAFERALEIRSQTGIYFQIKRIVIMGAPYFNLILSILGSTLFAYTIPIIVIEKKKLFGALIQNFKTLWGSFWFTFFLILLPSLIYVPILVLRNIQAIQVAYPASSVIILVVSIFVLLWIDAIVYTALTTYYLFQKEAK